MFFTSRSQTFALSVVPDNSKVQKKKKFNLFEFKRTKKPKRIERKPMKTGGKYCEK